MNHGFNLLLPKHLAQAGLIENIRGIYRKILSRQALDAAHSLGLCVAEVVQQNDIPPRLQQLHTGVASNVSRATGNQN